MYHLSMELTKNTNTKKSVHFILKNAWRTQITESKSLQKAVTQPCQESPRHLLQSLHLFPISFQLCFSLTIVLFAGNRVRCFELLI